MYAKWFLLIILSSGLFIVHEFGQAVVAKIFRVKIKEFRIGFGKPFYKRKFKYADFIISVFLFGGQMTMLGEKEDDDVDEEDRDYAFRYLPPWKKCMIVIAGPIANIIVAWFILWSVFFAGINMRSSEIGDVLKGSPAETAGILKGDKVVSVNGSAVRSWPEILQAAKADSGQLIFEIDRNGSIVEIPLVPVKNVVFQMPYRNIVSSQIGIKSSENTIFIKEGFIRSARTAHYTVLEMIGMIVSSIKSVITGAIPLSSFGGAITIYNSIKHQMRRS